MSTKEYDTATTRLIKMAWDLETDPASFDAKYPNEPVNDDGEIVALLDLDGTVSMDLSFLQRRLAHDQANDPHYSLIIDVVILNFGIDAVLDRLAKHQELS